MRASILGTCSDGLPGHPLASAAVVARNCNHSAFNGYHWTPSDYSLLVCMATPRCRAIWRTKAAYVDLLPNAPADW